MPTHCVALKHPVVLAMNSAHQEVHCHTCSQTVQNDNRRRDIKAIRDTLNQVQHLDAGAEYEHRDGGGNSGGTPTAASAAATAASTPSSIA